MPVIRSKIKVKSDAFAANAQRMQELLAEVQRLEQMVIAESESKRDKFEKRGQLLPRERVARLLDRGSPFLELSRLAGLNMHDDDGKKSVMGGGSIVGIGVVAGKRCVISANDSAVKGGTVAPMGLKKGSAHPADRPGEQAAPDLAGGKRRRQPDVPERNLHRGRPHLCQPGAHVGHGPAADRGGAWLLHGRRRLPAGAVRLRDPGARALQHLPGRPAAGQGRHRRGVHRRRARWRGNPCPGHGPGRVPVRRRRPRDRHGARSHGQAQLGPCPARRHFCRTRCTTSRNCWASCPPTSASPTTCAK